MAKIAKKAVVTKAAPKKSVAPMKKMDSIKAEVPKSEKMMHYKDHATKAAKASGNKLELIGMAHNARNSGLDSNKVKKVVGALSKEFDKQHKIDSTHSTMAKNQLSRLQERKDVVAPKPNLKRKKPR